MSVQIFFVYVWLNVPLELYSYYEPTRRDMFYFISLLRLYTFRATLSPSSRGQVYNVAMVLVLLLKRIPSHPGPQTVALTFWHRNFILHTLYIKCKNTGPK
jgi:hypothetical protein